MSGVFISDMSRKDGADERSHATVGDKSNNRLVSAASSLSTQHGSAHAVSRKSRLDRLPRDDDNGDIVALTPLEEGTKP